MIFVLELIGEVESVLRDLMYNADYIMYWSKREQKYYSHKHVNVNRYTNYEKEIRAKNCRYYEL